MRTRIACIVEGHGEVAALRFLLVNIGIHIDPNLVIDAVKPIRLSRGKFFYEPEFERFLKLASSQAGEQGAVLALADADDDCPVDLQRIIRAFGCVKNSALPVGVVFAKRMFEAWFLGSAASLAGQRGLPLDLAPPPDPEAVGNPKAWLAERHLENAGGRKRWSYSETTDQPAFAKLVDVERAKAACPSFEKLVREVRAIVGA